MTDTSDILSPDKLAYAAEMLKVLGHPVRLVIVEQLVARGELTVNQLVEALGEPQSTVSQHLNKMRARGLLGNRREGVNVMYFITQPQVPRLLQCIRGCRL